MKPKAVFCKSHYTSLFSRKQCYFYSTNITGYYETVEKMLREKFSSVRFKKGNFMFPHFYFKNEADEAAFLLWSSDGVEI